MNYLDAKGTYGHSTYSYPADDFTLWHEPQTDVRTYIGKTDIGVSYRIDSW